MDKGDKLWRVDKNDGKKAVKVADQQLLNACYFGNCQQVVKWLKAGGNPNYMEERDGWLPIHYAARWGDIPMLYALIRFGADIDGKTNSNETALHKAARWDRYQAAIILLRRGASPTVKNGDGNKPSDMTQDQELKFMMNNFEEWGAQQKIKKEQKAKAAEEEKRNKLNRNGSLTVNSEVYEIVRR